MIEMSGICQRRSSFILQILNREMTISKNPFMLFGLAKFDLTATRQGNN